MSTYLPGRKKLTGRQTAVLLLLGLSVFINYIDRGNLSIAAPMLKDELGISAANLGLLLSAFFWTYACLLPFAGWLVDRFDVNWVLAAGFALWSCATTVTGIVHTFAALFLLRLLLGTGESVAYPAYSKIIALHFPEEHRGLANSIVNAGLMLGPGLGMLMGGMLMARFGWRPFFIVLGLVSLLWLVPWVGCMPGGDEALHLTPTGVPSLAEFLGLRSAWGSCAGLFSSNYLNYFLITWLPFYLVRERHFSMDKMATVGGTAYLVAAASTALAGWLSDRWIVAGATPTLVRKTFAGAGVGFAGIFLGLAALSGPRLCVLMLTLGAVFIGVTGSNVFAITQTLAGPYAAGRWTGFQNAVGNLAGVVAPALAGLILQRTGHFEWAFALATVVALLGAASWFFLVGRIEPVVWHKPPQAAAALP